ncbi:hypothetical protein [Kineococcus rhizosphaerae]|uniref:Uncharacterized protein n=1 Tax=Kineococcus rhizosphaerae TaxID=559628 RepID=A0A2T0RAR1_9ACTN|nr:hypothetical protein [Kineococcus rhizosphaerae]PRY18252.1 hypothetical protein CLV37_101497 [Kineococcus rhizosphaerae]
MPKGGRRTTPELLWCSWYVWLEVLVKPMWQVVRDLEFAYKKGRLTPSFLDYYAEANGERISALYALCAKNFLDVEHEIGRNDHIAKERTHGVDQAAVNRALEEESRILNQELRNAREDGRPYYLRKPTKNAQFVKKPGS